MVPRLFPALALTVALLTGCTSNDGPRNPPAGAAPATPVANAPAAAAPPPAAASATPSPATATATLPSPTATALAAVSPAAAPSAAPAPPSPSPAAVPSAAPVIAVAPTTPAPPAPAPSPPPSPTAADPTPAPPVSAPPAPPVSAGFRIRLPAAGIDAAIVNVGLEPDGSMAAPNGPDIVGWFAPGARPGQPGNVLLDGHVDWSDRVTGIARTAVFYPLKDVRLGHDIVIDADGRQHTYRVRETTVFAWDDPSALRVLQPTSDAVVTLITCEGSFDRGAHNYSHRRVVIAALVASE